MVPQMLTGTPRLRQKILAFGMYSFTAAAFALIALFILQGGSPYPYSDDWALVPYSSGTVPISMSWLWDQHVDHRIPIPKALWVLSLRASGLDFRSGMIINAICAFMATILVLWAIRTCRGRLLVGDFLVPLVLLNPALNIFYWGFYLQFIASVMLALTAVSLGMIHFATFRQGFVLAAAVAIFCLNGVGMNGTVMAIVLGSFLIAALLRDRRKIPLWEMISATVLASATLIVAVYVIATWSPSPASGFEPADASTLVRSFGASLLALSAPRAWAGSVLATDPYLILCLLFSVAAACLLLVRTMRSMTGFNIYLTGAFLAGWSVLGAIALGRAGFWSPGMEYHYGYFPVLTVITAWVILSIGRPTGLALVLGLGVLVVFGSMYAKGVAWGINNSNERAALLAEIREEIANGVDLETIARNNISVFWWKSDEQGIALIAKKLKILQSSGVLK